MNRGENDDTPDKSQHRTKCAGGPEMSSLSLTKISGLGERAPRWGSTVEPTVRRPVVPVVSGSRKSRHLSVVLRAILGGLSTPPALPDHTDPAQADGYGPE